MKRKAFEMKLQEEELADKKEEKAKKEKQLEETKKIEKDAIQLNQKESELKANEKMVEDAIKEVSGEAAKVKKDADTLKLNEVKVEKLEKELEAKRLLQEKKEKREKELLAKKKMEEAEKERRERLKSSCPQSKVRTYVCKADGTRLIKYFDYQYDFEENQCVENVKSKSEKCKDHVIMTTKAKKKSKAKAMSQVHQAAASKSLEPQVSKSEEEKEADEALNTSHNDAGDAEDFQDATPISFVQKKRGRLPRQKSKLLAQTADSEPVAEEADPSVEAAMPNESQDDQQPAEAPQAPSSPMPKALHAHSHQKRDLETEKIKLLQNKQIQALTSNLGKLEGKVSEMTRKYEELQKKDAIKAKLEKNKEQKAHVIAQ